MTLANPKPSELGSQLYVTGSLSQFVVGQRLTVQEPGTGPACFCRTGRRVRGTLSPLSTAGAVSLDATQTIQGVGRRARDA